MWHTHFVRSFHFTRSGLLQNVWSTLTINPESDLVSNTPAAHNGWIPQVRDRERASMLATTNNTPVKMLCYAWNQRQNTKTHWKTVRPCATQDKSESSSRKSNMPGIQFTLIWHVFISFLSSGSMLNEFVCDHRFSILLALGVAMHHPIVVSVVTLLSLYLLLLPLVSFAAHNIKIR